MSLSDSVPGNAGQTFDEYICAHLAELEENIGLLVVPIIRELVQWHDNGRVHGGIHPGALRYSPESGLDADHCGGLKCGTRIDRFVYVGIPKGCIIIFG